MKAQGDLDVLSLSSGSFLIFIGRRPWAGKEPGGGDPNVTTVGRLLRSTLPVSGLEEPG